jgi:hypothetical protein
MTDWNQAGDIAKLVISSSVVSAVVSLVVAHFKDKKAVQLAKDMEKLKSDLAKLNAADIEKLKHKLGLDALEHNIRFQKLHEKTAVVIVRSFKLIQIAYRSTGSFVSPMDWAGEPRKEGKLKIAGDDYHKAVTYIYDYKLLFPPDVFRDLADLLKQMYVTISGFQTGMMEEKDGIFRDRENNFWSLADKDFKKLAPLHDSLHDKMQKALGFRFSDEPTKTDVTEARPPAETS